MGGVDFEALRGVGVVHAEGLGEFACGIDVVGAGDADVHFLEEDDVGGGESLALAEHFLAFFGVRWGFFWVDLG